MESPGPGYGYRGFLVQRNHESGGIVIGVSLPRGELPRQSAEETSCNRDIFVLDFQALALSTSRSPPAVGTGRVSCQGI
jgi:hypothetical protein